LGWFGRWRICRFSAVFGRRRVSEGAPERGKRFRWRRRGAGSLVQAESKKSGDDACRLRREISLWFVDDFVKEQRDMEEDGEGSL
jgi:hypothetical protein